jgi:transposase-like protein
MIEFKGSHFEREVILWGMRWYVAYPISYRQLEEMMQERGVEVDHSTLNRWVLKYVPLLDQQFRARNVRLGPVGEWTRPMYESRAFGSICIARSTKPAPRWISC